MPSGVIQWSNFSHSLARDAYVVGGQGYNGTEFMYISAPAFAVQVYVHGALFSTAEIQCRFFWYNWATRSWSEGTKIQISASGASGENTSYYYHNYNGSNTDSAGSNHHLWRVNIHSVNSGSNRTLKTTFYVGGVGCMSEPQYNSICKPNKLLVSAGRLDGDWLHSTSTQDDAGVVSMFNWGTNTGTRIMSGLADKIIPKSWV